MRMRRTWFLAAACAACLVVLAPAVRGAAVGARAVETAGAVGPASLASRPAPALAPGVSSRAEGPAHVRPPGLGSPNAPGLRGSRHGDVGAVRGARAAPRPVSDASTPDSVRSARISLLQAMAGLDRAYVPALRLTSEAGARSRRPGRPGRR